MIKFTHQGNTYQMQIENGLDLEQILRLDEAIWVAMSAPVDAFQCDARFLQFIESDKNGQIGSDELKQAIAWLLQQLPDHAAITKEFDGKIKLADICTGPEGSKLVDSAKYVLADLGEQEQDHITLEYIRKFQGIVRDRPLNGDGILSVNSAKASKLPLMEQFLKDAIAATGGSPDADGSQGVNAEQINQFLDALPQFLQWKELARLHVDEERSPVMSLGIKTPELYQLLNENADKVEHFFRLCELLAFDARVSDKTLSNAIKVQEFDPAKADEVQEYVLGLPLAQPNIEGKLPLDAEKINPAFRSWWQALCEQIIRPELKPESDYIDAADWQQAKSLLAPYEAYLADKKGAIVENVPMENLQAYQDCKELRGEAADLITRDQAVAETLKAADEVERLLLYRANLLRLANNFVSFPELYAPQQRAMFERGSLVIDGRWFNLAFPVKDLNAHLNQAKKSSLFVLYVEIFRSATEKPIVAVPVTTGSKGNLAVGKRGVFFDLERNEYPALVVQIIENPVCLAEALVAPFVKAWSMTEKKIESWSSSTEKAFQEKFDKAITIPPAGTAAPAPPPAAGAGAGAFLGISVAFAALGSAFAFISKTIAGMSAVAIIVSVICGVLILIFPISLLAILKLRRQDISSLLEGSGWAINSRMRLNNKQRRQFSRFGLYPADAIGTPRNRSLSIILFLILIVLLVIGGCKLYRHIKPKPVPAPEAAQTTAPAPEAPTTPAAPTPAAP